MTPQDVLALLEHLRLIETLLAIIVGLLTVPVILYIVEKAKR